MKTKRIKILLIQPPVHDLSIYFGIMEPYALEVLDTAIENEVAFSEIIETRILDLRVVPINSFIKLLKSGNIDIVGITGITIDQPKILEIAFLTKNLSPSTTVLVGGHHATMLPNDFFVNEIDLIVRGPGHNIIIEIIKRKISNLEDYRDIKGVISNNGSGEFTECPGWADNIGEPPPLPSRRHIKKRYRCFGHRINVVVTAQGCNGRCSFCACWPVMAGKYIIKSPAEVYKEIAMTKEKWIFLGDDNTFQEVDKMKEVAQLIKSSSLRKYFDAYCRSDIIVEHPELIEMWSKIGLKYLTVGFEHITDKGLDDLNKNSSIHINEEANRILLKFGVVNLAHLLISPSFTYRDFQNIRNYIYKLGIVEPVFPILTPLPGTALWRKHKEEVKSVPRQFFDLAHPITRTNLKIEEFYSQYINLIKANYSTKRWLMSKSKALANLLLSRNIFPSEETSAASLLSLTASDYMIGKKLSSRKLQEFTALLK